MDFHFIDLRCKEVISLQDGCRLGRVDDLVIEQESSRVKTLIIFGRPKFFGLLGREDDIFIDWCKVRMIGEDTILVETTSMHKHRCSHPGGFFSFKEDAPS